MLIPKDINGNQFNLYKLLNSNVISHIKPCIEKKDFNTQNKFQSMQKKFKTTSKDRIIKNEEIIHKNSEKRSTHNYRMILPTNKIVCHKHLTI